MAPPIHRHGDSMSATQAAPDASRQARRQPEGSAGIPAILAAIVAGGLLGWFWLLPMAQAPQAAQDGLPVLTDVAAADRADALQTLDPNRPDAAAVRAHDPGACKLPLASLTLAAEPGSRSASLRITSGHYSSAMVNLTETPVRIAVPYPGPPAAGQGSLVIMVGSGHARVGLSPSLHVGAEKPLVTQTVHWAKPAACPDGAR